MSEDEVNKYVYEKYSTQMFFIDNIVDNAYDDNHLVQKHIIAMPNTPLIENLTNSLFTLSSLELVLALEMVKEKGKSIPIGIKIGEFNDDFYKKCLTLSFILNESKKFREFCNVESEYFFSLINGNIENDFDEDFIDYANNVISFIDFNQTLFNKSSIKEKRGNLELKDKFIVNSKEMINFYNSYTQKYNRIILIDDKHNFDLIDWALEHNIEKETAENDSFVKFLKVKFFDPEIQKSEIEIKIALTFSKINDDRFFDLFKFAITDLSYQVIKTSWAEIYSARYKGEYDNKFIPNLPIKQSKELLINILDVMYISTMDIFNIKEINSLYNELYKIYENDKKHKYYTKTCEGNSSKKPCSKKFLAYKSNNIYCTECSKKTNYSQRSRQRAKSKVIND